MKITRSSFFVLTLTLALGVGIGAAMTGFVNATPACSMFLTAERRSVAMKLTGHKTENVYRRYAIVSDADLDSAAQKLSAASAGR
jgi:hypothetical protein